MYLYWYLQLVTQLRLDYFVVTSSVTQSNTDSVIYVGSSLGYEQFEKDGNVLLLG